MNPRSELFILRIQFKSIHLGAIWVHPYIAPRRSQEIPVLWKGRQFRQFDGRDVVRTSYADLNQYLKINLIGFHLDFFLK